MTTDTAPRTDRVVHRDRYDDSAWVDAVEANPDLVDVDTLLASVNPVAPAGFTDAFHTLHKGLPRLTDPDELAPRYRVNAEIIAALMGSPTWTATRQTTVGDTVMAGLAMADTGQQLLTLYRQMAPVQQAADAAQAAQDRYEEACSGDGDGAEPDDGLLDELRDRCVVGLRALETMVDAMGPVVEVGARGVAHEAAKATERCARAATGWGLAHSELSTMDPTRRLELVRRLTDPRTERIAEIIGRLDAEVTAQQSHNWDVGNGEIAGITLGNDLSRLLPAELLGLCHPALIPEFLDRYDNRRLMQTERRERPRLDRGGIVYVEDSSTTMRGDRSDWARALGVTLLRVAMRQHRAFRAIVFAGPDDPLQVFDFGDDASTCTIDQQLAYVELAMKGNTDFMRPLGRALEFIQAEHDATGRTNSDVVFATDGQAPVTDTWLDDWAEAKDKLGMRCYGIAIGHDTAKSIDLVSDYVTAITRFVDGTDIGSIFRAVTQPQEPTP